MWTPSDKASRHTGGLGPYIYNKSAVNISLYNTQRLVGEECIHKQVT